MHHVLYDKDENNNILRGVMAQVRTMAQMLELACSNGAPLLADDNRGMRTLDMGCGIGGASRYLARTFGSDALVDGLILSPIQAKRALEHSTTAGSSGEPEGLKYLIDKANKLGLYVLMNVVHNHASSNSMHGINQFDRTDHQYFHSGERSNHTLWDSRLFNYGHCEVLRFLFSNLRWYVDEYHFDGFRFDCVTSMLYLHRGISVSFSGGYHKYFGMQIDVDACIYMMLANTLLHGLYPDVAVTIAEDVSRLPTLCVPVKDGGLGFDYRLAMAVPDMWIKMFKELQDENWEMGRIVHTLTNRQWNEKTIGYCDSHEQALVWDKTIAFWLMDAAMYKDMNKDGYASPAFERGISLHKLIRLVTMVLGGEGYITVMGNEFGHPERVDCLHGGIGFSYKHACRRWDLCENGFLRYRDMYKFEKQMHDVDKKYPF